MGDLRISGYTDIVVVDKVGELLEMQLSKASRDCLVTVYAAQPAA